ncbi:hypothetical protein DER45DRAFT_589716 [Fusarium avenaceum]|nr:hypothetical protein DER45DRAFT_589716 [Fusarium avenaceum]
MHYKLATLVAVGLTAMQTIAYSHGEEGKFNGKAIKWQQLAEGVFTGVPAEKWDDKTYKKGLQELDIEEIMSLNHNTTIHDRDLELEERNIPDTCRAAVNCFKAWPGVILAEAYNAYFQTAEYLSGGKVMAFLNQPFIANAGGVAVAGVISGQVNEALKKECSSSGSEVDALKDAVKIALDANPGSNSVSVTITGPAGTWTIDVTAKPEGESPSPKCADS